MELLDSDLVPAIIEFYLDPISVVKKKFLKLVINHWICEICEMQKYLYKIIDPFAFAQVSFAKSDFKNVYLIIIFINRQHLTFPRVL